MENEFKGVQEEWLCDGNIIFANDYFQTHIAVLPENYTPEIIKANAQLISKAPEMLERLKEQNIDLKILKSNLINMSKSNHLLEGYAEIVQKWIDENENLIKEATTI